MGNIGGCLCCDNDVDHHSYDRAPLLPPPQSSQGLTESTRRGQYTLEAQRRAKELLKLKLVKEQEEQQRQLLLERALLQISIETNRQKKATESTAKKQRQEILRLQQEQEQRREKLRLEQEEEKRRERFRLLQEQEQRRAKLRLEQEEKQRRQRIRLQQEEKKQPQKELKRISIETTPKCIDSNPALIKEFLKATEYNSWFHILDVNLPYKLITLDDYSPEFSKIQKLFKYTNKKCFQVKEIKKIINPYLMMQYKLMKVRCRRQYGQVNEKTLFHGTREANIDSICKNNFDWRLRGRARGHIYGQGVSFSPISNYATHYSEDKYEKIMFVVYAIVNKSCIGDEFTVIPPRDCDTTTNKNQQVIVKYEDNAFYPCYIIYYRGFNSTSNSKAKMFD